MGFRVVRDMEITEVSSHGGAPSHHPNRMFHYKPSSYWGSPISGNPQLLVGSEQDFPLLDYYDTIFTAILDSIIPYNLQSIKPNLTLW